MSSCSIKWCGKNSKNSNYEKDGITFHRFPKDPNTKDAWITASKKEHWFPSNYSVICSRHFTKDCFEQLKGNRRRLYASAVPTLLLPHLINVDDESYSVETSSSIIHKTLPSSNLEEKPYPAMIRKLLATNHNNVDSPENISVTISLNTEVSQAEKSLCRKVALITLELKKLHTVVKRYRNKNRYLTKRKCELLHIVQRIKNKESITQDNIDIERLKMSNKQLRKRVQLLKQLLREEKKKNISKRNVVWCPPAEGIDPESREEM